MSRAVVIIRGERERKRICSWAMQAPAGTRVEFKETKRTIPQNDRMWAMLTDVANQVEWHGAKYTPDDWKLIFMDALNREMRGTLNIDGNGWVNLGTRSSDLSKAEMGDLMELIAAFGAQHGVEFHDGDGGFSIGRAGPSDDPQGREKVE